VIGYPLSIEWHVPTVDHRCPLSAQTPKAMDEEIAWLPTDERAGAWKKPLDDRSGLAEKNTIASSNVSEIGT